MKVHTTPLEGVLLFEPLVHGDERGFFLETYHRDKYAAAGLAAAFVQDNHSKSGPHILRGLHAQRCFPQGKLVRAVEGEVFDVAVDIRRDSPTFAQWYGATLSDSNFRQLYIPPGFAHGFCVVSPSAQVEYKCTELYRADDEIGIRWDDPDIAIDWPIEHPVLSAKDRDAPTLAEWLDRLPVYPDAAADP
ncbi:MAG: dTDP-4-dehydrorhamnose 3,5-epimerase [Acidobacteriota bacterium]